jgi:hypothetical protein
LEGALRAFAKVDDIDASEIDYLCSMEGAVKAARDALSSDDEQFTQSG